jgi:hypothetical protein
MNQTIEKWLTIAALAGWLASIGSLIGLAVRATAPAAASRPAQTSSVSVYNAGEQPLTLPTSPRSSVVEIPLNTSQGYWAESLKARSSSRK